MASHSPTSEKESVEQNLSKDYGSKSSHGNSSTVDDSLKKKAGKAQKEMEKFRTVFLKSYKNTQSIGVVPQNANKRIEEEYEISEEDSKRGLIHVMVIIPESQYKKISEIKLRAIQIAQKINDKFWVHVLTPVDFWNIGLDSKFDIMEALAMSYPVYDKGFLSHVRVAQIHKSLVLKKFEKYVTSYVIAGSLTTGTAKKNSDVDVFVVIDDTDVKRMPRMELREKLRGIIYSYIPEAEGLAGVAKNTLNVQVYLITEFWEAVKDAHPVMFTFIRDGIPFYDRGTFLPWKSLLKMGKIKPSPEAIDMFMSSGNKLKETIQKRIFDAATLDLFWGISTPTQGLLMLYGLAPPNIYETVKQFRDVFVKKEKLIEAKYADILDKIIIKTWKAYEHGKLKPGDISGEDLDSLSADAIDYIKRLKELREQIEKRMQEKSIEEIYEDVFKMLGNFLGKEKESDIVNEFNRKMVKEGKLPPRFLDSLKFIAKIKRSVIEKSGDSGSKVAAKQSRDVDNARKLAMEITGALTEYIQRRDSPLSDKFQFQLKAHGKTADVFFLKDTFLVQPRQIQKIVGDKLMTASAEELQEQIISREGSDTKLNYKSLAVLHKIFGEFDLFH